MADRILTFEELIKQLEKYTYKELHVHHTWKPDHSNWRSKPDGLYWNQSMRNYHVNTLGWQDIGQHVTLLPDGRFVTGRPFNKTPASISGYNTGAFAVEMIGNFDIGKDKLEGEQKKSIIELARYFYKKGRYIRFHRENSAKTCPGSGIDKEEFMREVRGEVENMNTKNEYVLRIQTVLKNAGIDPGPLDGVPGPKTLKGVETAIETITILTKRIESIKNYVKNA